MAAIDKIYGTKAQYDELRAWCEQHYPAALPHFYQWAWADDGSHPITNFPTEIDVWLLKNCPLPWLVERIKYQYNMV